MLGPGWDTSESPSHQNSRPVFWWDAGFHPNLFWIGKNKKVWKYNRQIISIKKHYDRNGKRDPTSLVMSEHFQDRDMQRSKAVIILFSKWHTLKFFIMGTEAMTQQLRVHLLFLQGTQFHSQHPCWAAHRYLQLQLWGDLSLFLLKAPVPTCTHTLTYTKLK